MTETELSLANAGEPTAPDATPSSTRTWVWALIPMVLFAGVGVGLVATSWSLWSASSPAEEELLSEFDLSDDIVFGDLATPAAAGTGSQVPLTIADGHAGGPLPLPGDFPELPLPSHQNDVNALRTAGSTIMAAGEESSAPRFASLEATTTVPPSINDDAAHQSASPVWLMGTIEDIDPMEVPAATNFPALPLPE